MTTKSLRDWGEIGKKDDAPYAGVKLGSDIEFAPNSPTFILLLLGTDRQSIEAHQVVVSDVMKLVTAGGRMTLGAAGPQHISALAAPQEFTLDVIKRSRETSPLQTVDYYVIMKGTTSVTLEQFAKHISGKNSFDLLIPNNAGVPALNGQVAFFYSIPLPGNPNIGVHLISFQCDGSIPMQGQSTRLEISLETDGIIARPKPPNAPTEGITGFNCAGVMARNKT